MVYVHTSTTMYTVSYKHYDCIIIVSITTFTVKHIHVVNLSLANTLQENIIVLLGKLSSQAAVLVTSSRPKELI